MVRVRVRVRVRVVRARARAGSVVSDQWLVRRVRAASLAISSIALAEPGARLTESKAMSASTASTTRRAAAASSSRLSKALTAAVA